MGRSVPNYRSQWVNRGVVMVAPGDYIGAERNFRIAMASAGENLNAKMGLGIALRVRGGGCHDLGQGHGPEHEEHQSGQ